MPDSQADPRGQPAPSAGAAPEARVATSTRFADWTHILFDQALLAEGGQLDDPARS